MLWFILAALTGATLLCILWPLRASRAALARRSGELAILRGQIEGVSADMSQGYVAPGAGEAARAELGRRIIAATQREAAAISGASGSNPRARRALAAGLAALCVPALTFGVYGRVGDAAHVEAVRPASVQAATAETGDVIAIVARVEAHLASHPDDGRGYEVLAPVYLRMGRAEDAAQAWAAAIRLLGATAERQSNYGEALFAAAGNIVTKDARAAFDAAAALDVSAARPRFYLGLAAEQEGDRETARTRWKALADDAPQDAPWLASVRDRLAALDAPPAARGAPPALASMPPAQAAMVKQMVEGLAARLASDGHDLEGWRKLVRAYTVLAEPEKARDALRSARVALAADTTAMAALDALARDLGLGG